MERRSLLKSGAVASAALFGCSRLLRAAVPRMKITRIRLYLPPGAEIRQFENARTIVTVETDQGITGIGEGGTKEGIEHKGSVLIGRDPSAIENLWKLMWHEDYTPPDRRSLKAVSGLDLALWDIRGKALGVPVYELLGGPTRNYCECYSTSFAAGEFKNLTEMARHVIGLGFRCFRTFVTGRGERTGRGTGVTPREGPSRPFDAQRLVDETCENCKEIREAVGPGARWCIDYHTRLDPHEAVRLSDLIAPLGPYFAEDLIRSEYAGAYRTLRQQVKVPIAVGEHFGARWDINELIEQQLIDFSRMFPPNCGGISEFMKIAALCETHYVGLVPHLAGPISEAAVAHCCFAFSGQVLMEISGAGPTPSSFPHLPQHYDFKDGKVWPNRRPGLGVTFDPKPCKLIAEVTEARPPRALYQRPDGSWTNN